MPENRKSCLGNSNTASYDEKRDVRMARPAVSIFFSTGSDKHGERSFLVSGQNTPGQKFWL